MEIETHPASQGRIRSSELAPGDVASRPVSVFLRDQPIASSSVDRHGECIPEDELRQLFATMPDERPLYDNHDYTKAPVGRVSNCRLERLDGGALAIVCDIEIFDESRAQEWKGLSIGFHRRGSETAAPATEFAISFNPRSIPRADMEAVRQEFGADRVSLTERGEKSLIEIGIVLYVISQGFFEKAGADVYELWKATLRKALKRDSSATVAIESPRTERAPEMLLIPAPNLDPSDLVLIDFEGIIEHAHELAPGNEIVKVVVAVSEGGFAYLDHAVDARGVTIRPPS